MSIVLRPRLWVAVLVLFACQAAFSQVTANFGFGPTNSPVIDLNGQFAPTSQVISGVGDSVIPLDFNSVQLIHEANGRLHAGSESAIITIGGDTVAAAFTASGHVTGGGDAIKVMLTLHLVGTASFAGQPAASPFNLVITYNLKFNSDAVVLEGTSHGVLRITGFGQTPVREAVSVPLPNGDGSWTVSLTYLPLAHIGGSGTVNLATAVLTGTVNGSVGGSTGLARVHLVGGPASRGLNVNFNIGSTTDGAPELETMRGRLMGQKVAQ